MQSQQRAENGITEIIIGYVGHDPIQEEQELTSLIDLGTAFMDSAEVQEMKLDELPDDVRSVVLAEKHRKETGAILPSEFYKRDPIQRKGGT